MTINVNKKIEKKQMKEHEKAREYQRIFNLWRFYDSLATFFSLCGLLLGMISYEIAITDYKPQTFDIDTSWSVLAAVAMN